MELFLYDRVLALFSAVPYQPPQANEEIPSTIDLTPHLTNTSLQTHRGEEGVRLLQELIGCRILSGDQKSDRRLTSEDVDDIIKQMSLVLSETFKAASQMPVHFQVSHRVDLAWLLQCSLNQPLPNAFELFGVDFLVVDEGGANNSLGIKLLEINAEPAIELTGPRLSWILKDLFIQIGKTYVEPFFDPKVADSESWLIGDTKEHFIKCLDGRIRGMSGI